jgi:hypothetical protein
LFAKVAFTNKLLEDLGVDPIPAELASLDHLVHFRGVCLVPFMGVVASGEDGESMKHNQSVGMCRTQMLPRVVSCYAP